MTDLVFGRQISFVISRRYPFPVILRCAPKARLEGRRPQAVLLTDGNVMGAFAYMLRCGDGSYYVGCATGDDLSKRVAEHELGERPGYTSTRRPVHLVWSQHFERITDAVAAERKIKGWSRAKKEALIKEDWESIRILSRRRGGRNKVS